MISAGPAYLARIAATDDLRAAGIESPEYDAAELLAGVLGLERGLLPLADDLTGGQAANYADVVRRRARREPLQHILGNSPFYGLELNVGPGVFIPRPETELVVERAIRACDRLKATRVLDLCSGSGAIPIAIATKRPALEVVAVELDSQATVWLRRNVDQFAPSVRVLQHDATAADLPVTPGVDVITCNPPYVPVGSDVSPEVLEHDPHAALFGGQDGLDLIRPLIGAFARLLRPGGMVLMEHDETHQDEVIALFAEAGSFEPAEGVTDLTGRPRLVTATRS